MAKYEFLNKDGVVKLWSNIKTKLNGKVDKVEGKGLSANDYTTEDKNKLAGIANSAQVNILETVKVNGTTQTITDKSVNIVVPTDNKDIANGAGYQTKTDVKNIVEEYDYQNAENVQSAINTAVSSVYKYKGSVANEAALPKSNNVIGDVYNLEDSGMNVAWDGSKWDNLAPIIDLTPFMKTEDYIAISDNEIDEICAE